VRAGLITGGHRPAHEFELLGVRRLELRPRPPLRGAAAPFGFLEHPAGVIRQFNDLHDTAPVPSRRHQPRRRWSLTRCPG
jgi:hypothetical protein